MQVFPSDWAGVRGHFVLVKKRMMVHEHLHGRFRAMPIEDYYQPLDEHKLKFGTLFTEISRKEFNAMYKKVSESSS